MVNVVQNRAEAMGAQERPGWHAGVAWSHDRGPMSKPKKTSQPRLSAADKAEAILGGSTAMTKGGCPCAWRTRRRWEKSQWWQQFKAGERSATKAVFDKLAAQGMFIHKTNQKPLHVLEGDDGSDGFTVSQQSAVAAATRQFAV